MTHPPTRTLVALAVAAWLVTGAPLAHAALDAIPSHCRFSLSDAKQVAGVKGLHSFTTGVFLKCSARHPDCCRRLAVDVTLKDPNDPASCVATLNYGLLWIDTRNGYKPDLVWKLRWDRRAIRTDFIFDQRDGVKFTAIDNPLVGVPFPLPVQPPTGYAHGRTAMFKWANTGEFGAAQHEAVVHPNGNTQVTCEPKDPGIVNTH